MKHKPSEYEECARWHQWTGSYAYYIVRMCQMASDDGAPLNAIYKQHGTDKWVTTDDMPPDHPFLQR